jgi:hypothetical protein
MGIGMGMDENVCVGPFVRRFSNQIYYLNFS